jgi:four helix bundle protein
VISLSRVLPKTNDGVVISRQLLRSGTAVGANVEEAEAGYSKDEFVYKMSVALKEAREAHYARRRTTR